MKGHNHGGNNGLKTFRKKDISKVGCFKCKKKGHYVKDCPDKKICSEIQPYTLAKGA